MMDVSSFRIYLFLCDVHDCLACVCAQTYVHTLTHIKSCSWWWLRSEKRGHQIP